MSLFDQQAGYGPDVDPGYSELFVSADGTGPETKCRFSRRDGGTPRAHVLPPLSIPSEAEYAMIGGVRFGSWEAMTLYAADGGYLELICNLGTTVGQANQAMQGKLVLDVHALD